MTGDRAPRSASRRTENGSDRYLSSNVRGGVTRNNRRRADATRVSVRGRWTHAAGPPTWGASLGREERGGADTPHRRQTPPERTTLGGRRGPSRPRGGRATPFPDGKWVSLSGLGQGRVGDC